MTRILHEEIEACMDCPYCVDYHCDWPDVVMEGKCPDEGIHQNCPLPKKPKEKNNGDEKK